MIVYTLTVRETGSSLPIETVTFNSSAATMGAIPVLLERHPGCGRIQVHAGGTYLFSVDCSGATLPD